MDIVELIMSAKIGRERKDAQVDTCAPFAAALYDVLLENGFDAELVSVGYKGVTVEHSWYHAVVSVDGTMYDSLGEFSEDILKARMKIKPTVEYKLSFALDSRDGCYDEDDYQVLYDFLVDQLRKAARKLSPPAAKPRAMRMA